MSWEKVWKQKKAWPSLKRRAKDCNRVPSWNTDSSGSTNSWSKQHLQQVFQTIDLFIWTFPASEKLGASHRNNTRCTRVTSCNKIMVCVSLCGSAYVLGCISSSGVTVGKTSSATTKLHNPIYICVYVTLQTVLTNITQQPCDGTVCVCVCEIRTNPTSLSVLLRERRVQLDKCLALKLKTRITIS